MSLPCPPPGIILEVVGRYNPTNAKNILFLGDGFANTTDDRKLFDDAILEIRKRFFKERPFNLPLLKAKLHFNFFKVFTPSSSSGISYQEVDRNNNISEGHVAADGALHLAAIGRIADKNSALGLTYQVVEDSSGNWSDPRIWYKRGRETCVMDIVNSLTFAHPVTGAIDPTIPACWNPIPAGPTNPISGRDRGLICVLVNDDVFTANTIPIPTGVTLPATEDAYIAVSLGSFTKFNKIEPSIAPNRYDHTPISPTRRWYKRILHAVLHEFGHSQFGLGDEYEGKMDSGAPNFQTHPSCSGSSYSHLCKPNLTTNKDIGYPPSVDASKIKWNEPLFPGSTEDIIPPKVISYLTATSPYITGGPLYVNTNTNVMAGYRPRRPDFPFLIEELKRDFDVKYPSMVIGLFEGGGTYYRGVYTPAGICKMRGSFRYLAGDPKPYRAADYDFCYICKKRIVEKIADDLTLPKIPLLRQLAKKYDPYRKRRR